MGENSKAVETLPVEGPLPQPLLLPPCPNITAAYNLASEQPAVEVRNAYKSYNNGVPVLQNFEMTVQRGTIYSLLGSSGCGKTTILSCIVGLRQLDAGDIWVYGAKPGTKASGIPGKTIGFMPQDTALYKHLTIKEMLQYFGRIYGMTNTEIMTRIEFCSSFLNLPSSSRRIGELSGGQSRRVSLACCILHEPQLLILDEPTVGVDPLLRESIWNYLCDLVLKKHVSVIITTHYIEEARQSNAIGLMRNGRLLTEKSPDALISEFNAILLEEIVLKLCKNDLGGFGESNHDEVRQTLAENSFYSRRRHFNPTKRTRDTVVGLTFKQNGIDENQNQNDADGPPAVAPKMRLTRSQSLREQATQGIWGKFSRIRAIAMRNILNLIRTPVFMLAIFFMPSFQVIITNLTLGPEPKNLAFGIIDPEINFDLSNCALSEHKKCGIDALSCRYIKTLPNNIIDPISVRTREQALEDLKIGKLWGFMEFPNNYSQHMVQRSAENIWITNKTIDGSTISLGMDYSNYFASNLLTKSLYESFQVFVRNTLTECDPEQDARKVEVPLNFKNPIYGKSDVTYQDYIGPAVLMIILFFIPYLSCAVYNITDRKEGTLQRSMVAGVTFSDLLTAFFCTEGLLILIQTGIAYLLIKFIFLMDVKGSVVGLLVLIVLTGAAGLSLGFLIAQLVDEEVEALILGIGFYMPNLIFCGLIWPLEAAPIYIRFISYSLPCTWAINALRSIINRGWPLTHPYVWPGFAMLLFYIVASWILAAAAFRRRAK